jgi:hypothetical protein
MTGSFASGVRITLASVALVAALPAQAQQPSKAETDAVRSNCRSDYMAKCMSVKPGGIEAIQCLKKNDASLSAACRSAVAAIKLPGEATPAATPKPASPSPGTAATPSAQPAPVTTAPAATAPAASKPEPSAAVPTPAKPQPPKPAQVKPATAPKPAIAAAPPATPAPAATPPATAPGPKLGPLQEAALVRRFCTTDFQVLCKGVRLGQGRAINCLAANQPALSPGCKDALANAR